MLIYQNIEHIRIVGTEGRENDKSKHNKQCCLIKIDVLGIESVRERMLGKYRFFGMLNLRQLYPNCIFGFMYTSTKSQEESGVYALGFITNLD